MRRFVCLAIGVIALVLPFSTFAEPELKQGFNDAAIEWHSIEDGIERATKEDKPILLVVHATWCPVCRLYKKLFFKPAIEKHLIESFIPVLIDVDEEPAAKALYRPDGDYIPRTMILRPDGTLVVEVKANSAKYDYFIQPNRPKRLLAFLLEGIKRTKPVETSRPKPSSPMPSIRDFFSKSKAD